MKLSWVWACEWPASDNSGEGSWLTLQNFVNKLQDDIWRLDSFQYYFYFPRLRATQPAKLKRITHCIDLWSLSLQIRGLGISRFDADACTRSRASVCLVSSLESRSSDVDPFVQSKAPLNQPRCEFRAPMRRISCVRHLFGRLFNGKWINFISPDTNWKMVQQREKFEFLQVSLHRHFHQPASIMMSVWMGSGQRCINGFFLCVE